MSGENSIRAGWKKVAGFFDKSVRTVQRWHAAYPMPIRQRGRIVIFTIEEMIAWANKVFVDKNKKKEGGK